MKWTTLLLGAAIGGALGYVAGAHALEASLGQWQILRGTGELGDAQPVGAFVTLRVARGGLAEDLLVEVTRILGSGEIVGRVRKGPRWGPPAGYAVQFARRDVVSSSSKPIAVLAKG